MKLEIGPYFPNNPLWLLEGLNNFIKRARSYCENHFEGSYQGQAQATNYWDDVELKTKLVNLNKWRHAHCQESWLTTGFLADKTVVCKLAN